MAVIKNTTIYLGVSMFQSLMSFLLLPLYTSLLDETQFGLASLINSVAGLLVILFIFGSQSVVSRLYFEYKDDAEKLKRFLGTVFLSKIVWNICLALILILCRSIIFPLIAKGVEFYPYLLIALGIGFFSSIFTIYQTLQQTKQEGIKYALVQVAYLVINNGISVLLLTVFKMKAEGIVMGTLIADVLMTTFVFYKLRKQIVLRIDKEIVKEAFSFSWPIFFNALFVWGMASVNRLILNGLVSIEIVGVYTIGFTIATIVNMVTVALNRSYTPWFFSRMKEERRDNTEIVRFSEFIILVYAIIALGLSLFSPEIVKIFLSDSYLEAWKIIPFLAFGYVFNGLYFFFQNIFNFEKKAIKYIPLYTLLAALINIGLSYLLIPSFGMIGSAIASLISMFILSLSTYLGSRHFINVGYGFSKFLPLILVPALMSLVVFIPNTLNFWIVFLIKIVYIVLCIFILYLLNRKKFGSSLEKQLENLKTYINEIKGKLGIKR